MKTLIAILTTAALLNVGAQRASADCGWATAGKVLTGLAIGGAVASALAPPPTVVYPAPPVIYSTAPAVAYSYTPAPAVAQAPVYVHTAPAPVIVYSAPVYPRYAYPYAYPYYSCAPPLVSVRLGYGGGHYYHYPRGHW